VAKWLVTDDDGGMTVEEADLPHAAARQASGSTWVDYLYKDSEDRYVYTLFDEEGNNTGDLTVEREADE
jgi:hypothetical protein